MNDSFVIIENGPKKSSCDKADKGKAVFLRTNQKYLIQLIYWKENGVSYALNYLFICI